MSKPCTHICTGLLVLCCAFPIAASAKNTESGSGTVTDARSAAKVMRQEAKAHHSKAMYLADLGRTQEAIEENRQAIAIDPNNPGYQILMGGLLVDDGQLECALKTYERVTQRFPDQAPYLDELISQLRMGLNMLSIEKALSTAESRATSTSSRAERPAQPDCQDAAQPIQVEIIDPIKPESAKAESDKTIPDWLDPMPPLPKPSKWKTTGKFLLDVFLWDPSGP